ncbi:MAG: hypothetical protein ACYC3W_02210 [Candidatus Nanopelagicales bacterium]
MLNIIDASKATGFSPKTLYAAASDGRIRSHRTREGVHIPLDEVARIAGLPSLGSRRAAHAIRRIEAARPMRAA